MWCSFHCLDLVSTVFTSNYFFRPTPSWLPPGRYTCSIAAKRWIVIIMQGCQLVDSHKSTGSGPVHSPASCPSKNQKTTPRNKRNQANQKHTTTTKPKQTKNTEKWDRYQQWEITCMMTSCVSLRMATEQEAKQRKHGNTQRGQVRGWWKQQSSMRKPGIPPARIPEITESSRSGITVSLLTSLMSLACSWTHVDSLDDVCNSFHSCHGCAVQLVDSFSLLRFGMFLPTCYTWFERVVSDLN